MEGIKLMKTWARAKAVAANAVKTVREVVGMPAEVPAPDYDNMSWTDLKMCARAEGLSIYHKTKSELRSNLWAVWNDDNE